MRKSFFLFVLSAIFSCGLLASTDYRPAPNIYGVHYLYNLGLNVYCNALGALGKGGTTFCAKHQAYQVAKRYSATFGIDQQKTLGKILDLVEQDPGRAIKYCNAIYLLLVINDHYENLSVYRAGFWQVFVGKMRVELPGFCMQGECTPEFINRLAEPVKGSVLGDALIEKCLKSHADSSMMNSHKQIDISDKIPFRKPHVQLRDLQEEHVNEL